MVQQCSLALIKPHLFCLYRPQVSGYIMPLKILVLSTQLSKRPQKNFTDYFVSTQSEYHKNYSMVFSLNLFIFFANHLPVT